jgi:hypothetical protein
MCRKIACHVVLFMLEKHTISGGKKLGSKQGRKIHQNKESPDYEGACRQP